MAESPSFSNNDSRDDDRVRRHIAPSGQIYDLRHGASADEVFLRIQDAFRLELDELVTPRVRRQTTFDFTAFGTIDACAVCDDEDPRRHYIGMHIGALPVVLEATLSLMASGKFLRDIGDPAVEAKDWSDRHAGFTPQALMNDPDSPPGTVPMVVGRSEPNDPDRARFAWLLGYLAIEYMFIHELAHVLSGHTLLARGRLCLNAVGGVARTPREAREYQVIEFDADNYAFRVLAPLVIGGDTILIGSQEFDGYSIEQRLRAWALATMVYFLLNDQAARQLADYSMRRHPHPHLRFVLCLEATALSLRDNGRSDLVGMWAEVHAECARTLSVAWRGMRAPGGFFDTLGNGDEVRRRFRSLAVMLPALHRKLRRWDARVPSPSHSTVSELGVP